MTEGNASSRKELVRGIDIFEFYSIMEVHEDIINKRLREIEKRRQKAERKRK